MLGYLRRNRLERPAYLLYGAAVAAARAECFYAALGVPDTLDGRFDLVSLHVYLVVRRLTMCPKPGPDLAQGVFDAMFADMDVNLREMGGGDLSVSRRNRAMWEAFHGRAAAYKPALDAADDTALVEVLLRNVWRGTPPAASDAPARLAAIVRRCAAALETQDIAPLAKGIITFPDPVP